MKKKLYIYIAFAVLSLGSCKKDFLEVKPLSRLTADNAFANESDAIKAIVGVYARLQGNKFYAQSYTYLNELPSDDIDFNEYSNTDHGFLENLTWNPGMGGLEGGYLANFWRVSWEGVQRANSVLDRVPAIPMDESKKIQILAEARFLRAFFYWRLTTDFGNIPLFQTVPQRVEDLYKEETSQANIYNFIVSELRAIENDLPSSWPGDETGRATRWAVYSLLGKTYLYQRDWTNAKTVLAKVVNESGRQLQPFANNFSETSENGPESIFEIQFQGGFLGNQVGIFFSDGGVSGENNWRALAMGVKSLNALDGQLIATKDIFNEFEPSDPRLDASIWRVGDRTFMRQGSATPVLYSRDFATGTKTTGAKVGDYYHVKKAVHGNATGNTFEADYGNNIVLFRLADVKLMYAEALAESGDLQAAADQLNQLRRFRRGTLPDTILPDFPYTTRYGGNEVKGDPSSLNKFAGDPVTLSLNLTDFRKALVHERRVELAFEYHRFSDLKRWALLDINHPGSAFRVFESKAAPRSRPADKKVFTEANLLYPKPLIEIDKSQGTLKQNLGY